MEKPRNQDIVVAVLPFVNRSGNSELNHLTQGFSEDLTSDLSRFGAIQVISFHSTKHIEYENNDHQLMIDALNCDYLITGSIRIKSKNLRINTQLIKTSEDKIVWAEKYEESLELIFEIQDEIIERVVNVFQKQIEVNLLTATRKKSFNNLEAYECWLRGTELLNSGSIEKDKEARKYFLQALKIDKNYSRAYSGMSQSYFNEWTCQLWELWESSQDGAEKYAEKAVELDETDYVSLAVLGRIYLYKKQYEKAEHFLRKSLQLNPNDSDNLIQISSCFVFLGLSEEAESLYKKAMRLNPLNLQWYYLFGAFISFQLGRYEECIENGNKINMDNSWVDLGVYLAAANYYLGNKVKMNEMWSHFIHNYEEKINKGKKAEQGEAVNWVITINPYKKQSQLDHLTQFLKHIDDNLDIEINEPGENIVGSTDLVFRKVDDLWEIKYEGITKQMAELKGFHDIARLLEKPNTSYHCTALMGNVVSNDSNHLVFDDTAREAYKNKISALQHDIEEADESQDFYLSESLRKEYDQLIDHLSKSVGFMGKTRKLDSPVEKARSAVTWRIRNAIKKIEKVHPNFSKHLTKSIVTGTFCTYSPEKNLIWEV